MVVNNPDLKTVFYEGLSMWPGFQGGDLLTCQPIAPDQIRVGDCVLFRHPDRRLVVHRVVGRNSQGLVTRGDALPAPDRQTLAVEAVMGKVLIRERMGRRTTIPGGWPGRLRGRLYALAGRIDPDRNALGGHLARGFRWFASRLLHPLWCRGSFLSAPTATETLWGFSGYPLARKAGTSGVWNIPWPQKLLIDPARLHARGKTC